SRWHTIFHENRGHADGVEPITDFGPFEIEGKNTIRAARTNEDRRSSILLRRWTVNGDGGLGNIAETNYCLSRDDAIAGLGHIAFLSEAVLFPGRDTLPKNRF